MLKENLLRDLLESTPASRSLSTTGGPPVNFLNKRELLGIGIGFLTLYLVEDQTSNTCSCNWPVKRGVKLGPQVALPTPSPKGAVFLR